MPALTKAGMQGSMARPAPCPLAEEEPRGPGLLLAGLCVLCGLATIHLDDAGHPRHRQEAP